MTEPDVSDLLSVRQAIEVIDSATVMPRVVRLPLAEAPGLRLAEGLAADRDFPPFDKSLMDGYAVMSGDVSSGPATLRLIGEVAAGGQATRALSAGEAVAIMTGAPMPPGAQGVVPIEETSREGGVVRVHRAIDPTRFVARRGADVAAGTPVLARGTRIEAPQIAVAAAIGAHHLHVHPRVRAAVLSTGDELVAIDQTPTGAQIRNSNGPMLVALLRRMGCDVADLGIVVDQKDQIRAAIEDGLRHDVLFVSGGMSMGAYDYVPQLLREMSLDLRITKLRIKPGKPFVFAVREGSDFGELSRAGFGVQGSAESHSGLSTQDSGLSSSYVFGLPGNPVSGFVCTVRLASRLIERLSGGTPTERWVSAKLAAPLPTNGPREFYQPTKLSHTPEGTVATPLGWKGSADLFTLATADGLLVREENEPARSTGDVVRVLAI
jgi:molybdopterin molybdotransferase